ncbi:MAG TPA: M12 family metallo-peptidase, partial [Saprospiraceae bacterium]|nr:M12 family metallo-peptidase [Saprospiraceae bacterium]
SVCNSSNKAKGVTGSGQPIGDAFDIDYVAHEMGHQFGGPHTFNGTLGSCAGNGNAPTAVEPGSGTTIMAYAGICGANNVQSNSNDYFHASSLQSIGTYITTGAGNGCAVKTVTGNNAPTVNAGPDYNLPKSTPFYLTATANDIDGDTLSYCWEQMDAGSGTLPPASTNVNGPMFRSFSPTAGPTRYFPRLSDLNANTNYAWEELPSVARTMRFRVTVRDNNFGSGCTKEDDMVVTISATAGPFQVTVPNTNVLWTVGETQTVTWNVASTDVAPISCGRVRILLSNNGGLSYPFVLAADVPNTGTADVLVPNINSSLCRVKVESIGNIFYDISNVNFRIQQPTSPTFLLATATNTLQACTGDTAYLPLSVTGLLGFNSPVQLSASGGPAGASLTFTPNPVTPTGGATLAIGGLTPDMLGSYTLTLSAEGSGITRTASVALTVKAGRPASAPALLSPADGQTALGGSFALDWAALPLASTYHVQLATSPSFEANTLISNTDVNADSLQMSNLPPGVYYWRVSGGNDCGNSGYAPTAAFQVGKGLCNQTFISTDTPQPISGTAAGTLTSVIAVPVALSTNDINVEINADHEWV